MKRVNNNKKNVRPVSSLVSALHCPRKARLEEDKAVKMEPHANPQVFEQAAAKKMIDFVPWNDTSFWPVPKGKWQDVPLEGRNLYGTVPYLEYLEDGMWKAIYPMPHKVIREGHLLEMMVNRILAREQGIEIAKHEILLPDRQYVRQKDLDADMAIESLQRLSRDRQKKTAPTLDDQLDALEKKLPVQEWSTLFDELWKKDVPAPRHCRSCQRGCEFSSLCWPEDRLPLDAPEFLNGLPLDPLFEKMPASLLGLESFRSKWSPLARAQFEAARNLQAGGWGIYIDKEGVGQWLERLQYPICYLDFEWDTFALPPYEGLKSFDVLCFQYSCHIEYEDGHIEQHSFFRQGDCREAFIQSLLEVVPETGSVVVFNREGAEKLRLQQLASQFGQYKEELSQIWKRMVDLSTPFARGYYHDLRQKGHCSLKTLVPLFSSRSYQELDVQDGLQTVEVYRHLHEMDPAQQECKIEQMKSYCALDSEGLIDIVHGLRQKLDPAFETGRKKKK